MLDYFSHLAYIPQGNIKLFLILLMVASSDVWIHSDWIYTLYVLAGPLLKPILIYVPLTTLLPGEIVCVVAWLAAVEL